MRKWFVSNGKMLYAIEDYFGSCQSIFAEHLKENFLNLSVLKSPISEVTRKKLHNEIQALGRPNGRKYCNNHKEAPGNSYSIIPFGIPIL